MMNGEPGDVPLRDLVADQAGPRQPTFQQLIVDQGAAAASPAGTEQERSGRPSRIISHTCRPRSFYGVSRLSSSRRIRRNSSA